MSRILKTSKALKYFKEHPPLEKERIKELISNVDDSINNALVFLATRNNGGMSIDYQPATTGRFKVSIQIKEQK